MITYVQQRKYGMFLPADYKAPKSGGAYMKIISGENRVRILTAPILGWEDWTLETPPKPVRFTMDNKPDRAIDPKKPIKHFWAMVVWNYTESAIQILEITQATLRQRIEELSNDNDWGAPFGYDIKIIKKGEKMLTEYIVNPVSHKDVDQLVKELFNETPINLAALFDGADPFSDVNHLNRAIPYWEMDAPSVFEKPDGNILVRGESETAYFTIDPALGKALEQMIQDQIAPSDPDYLQRLLGKFGKTSIDKIELMHQKNIAANIQLKIKQIEAAKAKTVDFDEVPF